eukprot:363970-Chlamydomonas_euryale.AAC.23
MQKLCDKVPSFDSNLAMAVVKEELGMPWQEAFAELTPEPIAAASLGQVYKGKLKTGEDVAVKVQRPYVLETVTVDLYIIRSMGLTVGVAESCSVLRAFCVAEPGCVPRASSGCCRT